MIDPQDGRPAGEARFLALIEDHKRTLYKVAYVYCRDGEERRDLVQEMAIQLWRSLPGYDGRSSLATWVYRVAMNVAISHRRREGRRVRATEPMAFGLDVADANQAFGADDDRSRALHALIDDLDEMSRALVLLYLDGFDHAEIAAMLGTTPGNVGTRLGRIKLRLQRQAGAIDKE